MRRFLEGSLDEWEALDRRLSADRDVVFRSVRVPLARGTGEGVGALVVSREGPGLAVQLHVAEATDAAGWLQPLLSGRAYETPRDAYRAFQSLRTRRPDYAAVAARLDSVDPGRPAYLDEDAVMSALRAQVIGQEAAVQATARAVVAHAARVSPTRPSVLFALGPTGVGKTLTARAVGDILPDHETVVLDMAEYSEPHSVARLIGAPAGYVGYDDAPELAAAITAREGRVVVVLDEIEKAHTSVLRFLLGVLDQGRYRTGGRAGGGENYVDCRNCLIFFTSNLCADHLPGLAALEAVDRDPALRTLLRSEGGLAPELIGRIGTFLVFDELSTCARLEIAHESVKRVALEYGVRVAAVDEGVLEAVVHASGGASASSFGARPAVYVIDRMFSPLFIAAARAGAAVIRLFTTETGTAWEES